MQKLLSRAHGVRIERLGLFFACLTLGVAALASLHLTVNITPSMPIGLYRLYPVDRPIARGDIVAICPPPQVADILLRDEQERAHGVCGHQLIPLLKFVAAVADDVVDLSDKAVVVNGVALPGSATMPPTKRHRVVMETPRGRYVIKPGEIWLWTPYYRSWDSRYFGPVSSAGTRYFARPVFVRGSWADWSGGVHRLATIPAMRKKYQ